MAKLRRPVPVIFATALSLFLALATGVAGAHATKERSVPEDGASVRGSPPVIAMMFDAPIRITMIALTGEGGQALSLVRNDDMAPVTRFEAAPEPLAPGRYEVRWRGLAEDGHAMEGRFSFTVE
ncbi:MAG: copper resistance CopC family protein [Pseudomonadota bacterium]